jgi:hypothetical protein
VRLTKNIRRDEAAAARDTVAMLFDGPPPELPTATLRPSVIGRRTILIDLASWLAHRQAWLRPRAVPLLAALAGLFATLGAVKAIGLWSHREPLQLVVHATALDRAPCAPLVDEGLRHPGPPILLMIHPLTPGDPYIELAISNPDPR